MEIHTRTLKKAKKNKKGQTRLTETIKHEDRKGSSKRQCKQRTIKKD